MSSVQEEIVQIIDNYIELGGPGSGHSRHAGRKGRKGGSLPRGAGGMIARPQGFTYGEPGRTSFNLYPKETVYVNGPDDYDNPKVDEVWDWAYDLTKGAKEQYPYTTYDVITGIHDADYRVYAEIRVSSTDGSHEEAAKWIEYNALYK